MTTPRDPAPASAPGAVRRGRHSLLDRLSSSVPARRWFRRSEGLSTREAWARYAVALGLGLGAIAVKSVVDASLGNSTGFLAYVAAVIIAARMGGLGGGLITTFVCAAGQLLVFDLADGAPLLPVDLLRIGWFTANGVLLSVVASGLRRASVAQQAARAQVTDLLGTVSRFKATVDASLEAVFMFDPRSLLVTYANRGAGELLGAEPDAIVGRRLVDLQPMLSEVALRDELQPLAQDTTDAVRYTSVIEREDGRHVPFEATVQHVRLPGEPGTMVLNARDISERIEVQARLARVASDERRQAAELRAVIQAMGEAVLVVAPRGDIRLANDAARAMLGTVPTALSELPGLLGVAEADLPRLGAFHAAQVIPVRGGGWLEVAAYLTDTIGAEAEGHSTILILRDVTAARQAEQAREAFIGVLSHELRTPVTTIYGYAKVLRRPNRRTPPAEMLADIEIEADRLYRIVEDLLALSRVEGGITVAGEPLLIQHLAEPLVTSEAQRWPAIHFEAEVPRDLPAVFGERTYVEQVLRNLLSNAAKYSPPDSTVTLVATSTPTDVLVRVLDRGAGIAEGESDRLFQLYYRSPRTARQATGAGIGLYVSRELIQAMGGRIWADPREGGGSDFGFSLPRCEEA